jgi:BirA family biotin operon repressor/biotin-[acetyl-CoA-carboxylase] ligase
MTIHSQPETIDLPTQFLGSRLLVYECVESTNSVAARLAEDESNHGTIVLAREQKAGRGQQGRQWVCPPDMGVLLSVLLFPPQPINRPAILTAWAAVSVCETIRQLTGLQAKIKWPNDVYLKGKKVCGILIEQSRGTVVGIGLNVNQTEETFKDLPLAGSLFCLTNQRQDCLHVAKHLIAQLDEEWGRMIQGDMNTLESCWQWRLGLLGKSARIETATDQHQGRLLEIGLDGMILELPGGRILNFKPEAVKHITALGS